MKIREAKPKVALLSKMSIIGEGMGSCIRPFKRHPTHKAQLRWQMIDVERYLE
jgi:hypothetical protein